MSRKLLLPLLAASSMLVVSAPAANAGTLAGAIKGINKQIKKLVDVNDGQTAAIGRVDARVDTIVGQLAVIQGGIPTIATALNALADPVTGLRALNLARPKYAVISTSSSGATVAGSTPGFGSAVRFGPGQYILNFDQDVSKRAPQLSINTPRTVAGASFVGQVLNCSASDTAAAVCGAYLGGKANVQPGHVLVDIQVSSSMTSTDGATFTVTEIAG